MYQHIIERAIVPVYHVYPSTIMIYEPITDTIAE